MRFIVKQIIFLCAIIPLFAYSNGNKERLKNENLPTEDTSKINKLLELAQELYYSNIDSALIFAKEASNISHRINEREYIIKSDIDLATLYSKAGKFEMAKSIYYRLLDYANETNDVKNLGLIYTKLGLHYSTCNDYDSAIFYLKKSIEICDSIDQKKTKAINLNGLGIIHWERGNYEAAINHYLEAYAIAEDIKDNSFMMSLLLNISIIYTSEGQKVKALKNYRQLEKLSKEADRIDLLSVVYNNMAVIFSDDNKFDDALDYYERSLILKRKIGDQQKIAVTLHNIGDVYFHSKQFEKAKDYINQSMQINETLQLEIEIVYNLETLIQINIAEKKFTSAKRNIDKALAHARNLKAINKERDILKLSSDYYQTIGNYRKAFEKLKAHNILADSLDKVSRSENIAQLQTRFETEKKEKENEILRVKNELSMENLRKQKIVKNYLIIFSILILALLILAVIFTRSKIKISKRIKKINGMLEESNNKLKVMNVTKDKFFSIIAHDLRSPFNAIVGFSELIKNELNSDTDKQLITEYNNSINDSARSLYSLLENLLQWARSQRGELEYKPTRFDLHNMIESNLNIFRHKANDKEIDLHTDVQPETYVMADENMVNTIVRNLISNAIKFTKNQGEVVVKTKTDGDFIEISVNDNGIGISKNNQEKLFRLDGNFTTYGTDDETGSGLGLILCKEFVEQNGGSIWVESKLLEGSQFKFTLKTAWPFSSALK